MYIKVMRTVHIFALLLFGVSAYAANDTVRITGIIPDYMPDQIRIRIDTTVGVCAAGTWLDRFGRGGDEGAKRDNNKAAYATLLAAMMSSKSVNIYLNDTNCRIENIQVIN